MLKIGDVTNTANDVGEWMEGNPAAGVEPTLIKARWLNTIQREMASVVEGAGLALDPARDDQVLRALKILGQQGTSAFAIDTGVANAYVCTFTPAILVRSEGQVLRFKVKTANTSASTFNDGLGAVGLVGGAHAALQGGELIANGNAWVQWNASVGGGSYILLFCTGAANQVAPATKSQHALSLGQATGRLLNVQTFKVNGTFTYTQTPGTKSAFAECHGAGASGAGTPTTGAGQCAVGGPGGSGAYASAWFPSGIPSGTSIVVGKGGVPVNGGGTNGTSSSIGSLMSSPGGRTGSTAGPSAPPLVTGGGGGATAPATVTGGAAVNTNSGRSAGLSFALGLGNTAIGGLPGADGQWGGGGAVVPGNTPGNSATAAGAGGSGTATNASQASIAGGAGFDGEVVIYEYGSI